MTNESRPRGSRRRGIVIAIDGPAGVGKSTVGHLVAKSLGCPFVNSGEMYRALTWKAMRMGVDVNDAGRVASLATSLRWEFRPTAEGTMRTFIDGENVAAHIRDERVSAASSAVAANPEVRRFLCRLQRGLGFSSSIVMEGRDIGTHVFPDADFKIYLDAEVGERAKRRYRQLKAAGLPAGLQKIREAMLKRDLSDLKRKINPLCQADDAIVIDSTHLTLHEVASKIIRLIRRLSSNGRRRLAGARGARR